MNEFEEAKEEFKNTVNKELKIEKRVNRSIEWVANNKFKSMGLVILFVAWMAFDKLYIS